MDGLFIFNTPVTGLKDIANTPLTEPVFRKEYIVKKLIRRLRVFLEFGSPPNQDVLKGLAASLELPGGFDGTGIDLVCLAKLDNPVDASIHSFYAYVETLKTKWETDIDEELTFKSNFP